MAAIDPGIAVSRIRTMEEILSRSVWKERFFATLLAFFGGLALLLAAVGLYGVMAYTVSRRTHEMGIRMAMGASSGEIRRMILRESGRLIAAGLGLGLLGAAAVTRYLETQLYGVSPTRCADAAGCGCRPGGRRNGGELRSRPARHSRGSHGRTAGGLGYRMVAFPPMISKATDQEVGPPVLLESNHPDAHSGPFRPLPSVFWPWRNTVQVASQLRIPFRPGMTFTFEI